MAELLLRFQNRTRVFHTPDNAFDEHAIVSFLSSVTHYPENLLQVEHFHPPFVQVRLVSAIRGGKGGFGTLLRGQGRQAGANATTDFGACRDLQGRRLRVVNQAAEHRLWREWKDKVDAGTATEAEMAQALMKTPSGVVGWHLQLPAWADVSGKKEQRNMKRKFYRWKREQDKEAAVQSERKRLREEQVDSYVRVAEEASKSMASGVASAIQEGLSRKTLTDQKENEATVDPPPALVSLSGDVVFGLTKSRWQLQSKSNFCSVAFVLDYEVVDGAMDLFYEIVTVSGGLTQVGWAASPFLPCSETGDGVGDCENSWAFDGSRQITLHNSQTKPSGSVKWKAGDVIGCRRSSKKLSWFLNGEEVGEGWTLTEDKSEAQLFPVVSMNPGELIEVHLATDHMRFLPKDAVPVEKVASRDDIDPVELARRDTAQLEPSKKSVETNELQTSDVMSPRKNKTVSAVVSPEALDLEPFRDAAELEKLGLDRLKGALMAAGVKCGGTLADRALRLFSLKGLTRDQYPKSVLAKKPKGRR